MTERRAHWSDDLIDAVFRRMDGYAAGVVRSETDHGTPTFDIIAAVEDWVLENYQGGEYDNPVEFTPEEAAIARVRELHRLTVDVLDGPGGPEDVEHCQECGYISIDAEPCPTIRAIEGEL